MTAALHLISAGGTPSAFPTVKASHDLERAWRNLCEARDNWEAVTLGDTDELVDATNAWMLAIDDYEQARVKLAEAEERQRGSTLLKVVVSNP